MENQIDKFARLCAVFNILVYDENPNYISIVKGDYEMQVDKVCLSNDYHLIKSLQIAYSTFRDAEQNKS